MLFEQEIRLPDFVRIEAEALNVSLEPSGEGLWEGHQISVQVGKDGGRLPIELRSGKAAVRQVTLVWKTHLEPGTRFLNDAWERSYGDLEWAGLGPQRVFPWYILANRGSMTWAVGVRTVPSAFCHWIVTTNELRLVCDVRCGTKGVALGTRALSVATVVVDGDGGASPFQTASRFCRTMCDAVLLPSEPIIGFNDWHYGYGKNSPETVIRDTGLLVELAPDGADRPFFMIDAGWQVCGDPNGGPWDRGNRIFGDMKKVADRIREDGARPGIWIRPLRTQERLPEAWLRGKDEHGVAMDPSIPEVLEIVAQDVRRLTGEWGFEMIKHDFTSFEIFGQWGFEMGTGMTCGKTMSFQDGSRTTAEIIRCLYETIREAAGTSFIDGCNVIGHLAPGCLDLQRTGEDTTAFDWDKTCRMGVNALAFRMPQHRNFFLTDADCVGITKAIPWHLNRQWLELLAASGTPLLISVAPDILGPEQKGAIRDAYAQSMRTQRLPVAEPLDWMDSRTPSVWRMGRSDTGSGEEAGADLRFDWLAHS